MTNQNELIVNWHQPVSLERRVLVVDDNASIRRFFPDFFGRKQDDILRFARLEGGSIDVETAEDGRIGLEIYADRGADLVITDLNMPGVNGMDVLSTIKAGGTDTKVIMITGYADVKSAVKAMELGAHTYLPKPIDVDEFVIKTGRAFEVQAIMRENARLDQLISMLRSFLPGGVAHNFNNIVQAVMGYIELHKMSRDDADLDKAEESAKRMGYIVSDLVMLSKLSVTEIDALPVDLYGLVDTTMKSPIRWHPYDKVMPRLVPEENQGVYGEGGGSELSAAIRGILNDSQYTTVGTDFRVEIGAEGSEAYVRFSYRLDEPRRDTIAKSTALGTYLAGEVVLKHPGSQFNLIQDTHEETVEFRLPLARKP